MSAGKLMTPTFISGSNRQGTSGDDPAMHVCALAYAPDCPLLHPVTARYERHGSTSG